MIKLIKKYGGGVFQNMANLSGGPLNAQQVGTPSTAVSPPANPAVGATSLNTAAQQVIASNNSLQSVGTPVNSGGFNFYPQVNPQQRLGGK